MRRWLPVITALVLVAVLLPALGYLNYRWQKDELDRALFLLNVTSYEVQYSVLRLEHHAKRDDVACAALKTVDTGSIRHLIKVFEHAGAQSRRFSWYERQLGNELHANILRSISTTTDRHARKYEKMVRDHERKMSQKCAFDYLARGALRGAFFFASSKEKTRNEVRSSLLMKHLLMRRGSEIFSDTSRCR